MSADCHSNEDSYSSLLKLGNLISVSGAGLASLIACVKATKASIEMAPSLAQRWPQMLGCWLDCQHQTSGYLLASVLHPCRSQSLLL